MNKNKSKVKLDPESKYLEDYLFFENPRLYEFSHKQLTDYKGVAEFVNWGRRNPVLFCEEIFGIEMLDYQKYIFMNTWLAQNAVWLMSRNAGKSILGGVYLQTRALLVPNLSAYIICGAGSQSIDTFTKIENLTKNNIPSFTTITDVFSGEIVKNQANTTGFVHNPSSHHFSLYNASAVFTVNGNYGNARGKRSNLNYYDEAMNTEDEQFRVTEPFTTQNAEFKLGRGQDNLDALTEPPMFPNQLIYASSAGTKEQYLYKKYREASIHMDAGDTRYFCIDLTADAILNATQRGVKLVKPLLTKEVIDARLREDKVAGMREYYNEFTMEDSEKQAVSRAVITRNSVPRVPELSNVTGAKKYMIAYDPARLYDNSAIGIGEVYEDPEVGYKMRIVNFISLADVFKVNKTPINTPAQIKELKKLILAYNGESASDYENILAIYIDAGSGGAGVPITDFLCEDWEDGNGRKHRGLIDNEYNEGDRRKYPNAVDNVLNLMSPRKYKSDMYEALIKMLDLNLIEFTEEYLDKGYVNLVMEILPDGSKKQRYSYPSEDEEEALRKQGIKLELVPYKLSNSEENALKQIDLAKGELLSMYRFKMTGDKDRFDLAPDRAKSMHDDRSYCLCMLGWGLAQLRRKNITERRRPQVTEAIANKLPIRVGKVNKAIG